MSVLICTYYTYTLLIIYISDLNIAVYINIRYLIIKKLKDRQIIVK